MNDSKHTANFLASSFLLSKRSRKKIYKLNLGMIAILRYICDSIDINFKKTGKLQTILYQQQIASQCGCKLRTVTTHIKSLHKKRLIKYYPKKGVIEIGKVLTAYAKIAYPIEVRKFCVPPRSTQNLPTSNASNITNNKNVQSFKNEGQKQSNYASVESQSNSYIPEKTNRTPMPDEERRKINRALGRSENYRM